MMKPTFLSVFVAAIFISSCNPDLDTNIPVDEKSMKQLEIPADFNFSTAKEVNIQFQDPLKSGHQAKYFIYLLSDITRIDTINSITEDGNSFTDIVEMVDGVNDLVATKISTTGVFDLSIIVPSYINSLYVRKNDMGVFSGQEVFISGNSATFQAIPFKNTEDEPVDVLYTVNGVGKMGTVNPVSGEMEIIENMPEGSWTAALDLNNNDLYFIGRNSPYALYKYNLDTRVFSDQGDLGMGGPRLDFNHNDGLLYFSNNDHLYTIDPVSAKILTDKKIVGLHNLSGGDLAFDVDGTLFMCSFSGLYRLEDGGATYNAIRISGEGLPFNPTSMTFDSNGELWLAHTRPSSLVVMDKVTGGWETRYANLPADINDLTTLPLDTEDISDKDTDNDGIIDFYDEFPDDAEKASAVYTPSVYGLGTIAFEDLWPAAGDFDFNDLVINYKFISIANAADEVVEIIARFTVKNVGGSLRNGFGFSMPVNKNLIESVSGTQISGNIVSLDATGLEADQEKAVIIVFEDAFLSNGETIEVLIKFVEPTDTDLIGLPPFDPFIFIGGDRSKELHLSDMEPTSLSSSEFFGVDQDASQPNSGIYYKSLSNLPWAIHIIHDFTYPLEKAAINKAYLKFNRWAESGGIEYQDWYKDDSGYRDNSLLSR